MSLLLLGVVCKLLLDGVLVGGAEDVALGFLVFYALVILLVKHLALFGLAVHGQGLILQLLDETL